MKKILVAVVCAVCLTGCGMTDNQKLNCVPTGASNVQIIRDSASGGEITFDFNKKHYRVWWSGSNSFIIEE